MICSKYYYHRPFRWYISIDPQALFLSGCQGVNWIGLMCYRRVLCKPLIIAGHSICLQIRGLVARSIPASTIAPGQYDNLRARSEYQWRGQVITSHSFKLWDVITSPCAWYPILIHKSSYLRDEITCPCPRYLLLARKSSYHTYCTHAHLGFALLYNLPVESPANARIYFNLAPESI